MLTMKLIVSGLIATLIFAGTVGITMPSEFSYTTPMYDEGIHPFDRCNVDTD